MKVGTILEPLLFFSHLSCSLVEYHTRKNCTWKCLEIYWMREMRSRLRKYALQDGGTTQSELWTHIMCLMRVLKQIKRNQVELN